jgi:spore photoproduct lyase
LKKNLALKRILVERAVTDAEMVRDIRCRLQELPVQTVESAEAATRLDKPALDKETLFLMRYKGAFLKPCPGTIGYICCGYQILNLATHCPLDCSYCILQAYFNQPYLRQFVNLKEGMDAVLQRIDSDPETTFRIGTGEFTDSLALDPVTHLTDRLLPIFSKRRNTVLELKTKTDRIERLLLSPHRDRIIVSWSLNSPYIATHEEHGAPGLRRRMEAARRCQSEGFVIGLHFDPLIVHPHWKEEYVKTIEWLDRYLDPERIIWISLGAFRFMPQLKWVIRRRHPQSRILAGEFVPGLDRKMRYFKPIRLELYGFMKEILEGWHRDLGLYLCMESDEVWRKALDWSPKDSRGLARFLDGRVRQLFG